MTELILHFVRHGETPGNAERRFQTPDVPLSEAGRAQAAAVAETIHTTTRAGALLASDYARTLETAAAISALVALPVVEEPALRERNFGIARGRLYSEFADDEMALWRAPHYRIEQGESWADVYDRMRRFLDAIRAAPPAREVILVSHGGAISVALTYLRGTPIDEFEIMQLENCAVRTVVLPLDPAQPARAVEARP